MPCHCRYFPMTADIQGYQYVFLKHITILVTTIHKKSYYVPQMPCHCRYFPMTADIQGYQYNSTCYNNS